MKNHRGISLVCQGKECYKILYELSFHAPLYLAAKNSGSSGGDFISSRLIRSTASVVQVGVQTPHPIQMPSLTSATSPSFTEMAPMGHLSSQVPQAAQRSPSTAAM